MHVDVSQDPLCARIDNLQVKCLRPARAPWSSTGLCWNDKNPSVWTLCLGNQDGLKRTTVLLCEWYQQLDEARLKQLQSDDPIAWQERSWNSMLMWMRSSIAALRTASTMEIIMIWMWYTDLILPSSQSSLLNWLSLVDCETKITTMRANSNYCKRIPRSSAITCIVPTLVWYSNNVESTGSILLDCWPLRHDSSNASKSRPLAPKTKLQTMLLLYDRMRWTPPEQ